jgi:hypothetical protein
MYVCTHFQKFYALFMVHGSRGDNGREEIEKSVGIPYSGLARRLARFTLVALFYVTVSFAGEKD